MKQDPENPANSSLSEPEPEPVHEEPWVPYVGSDGEPNEFFETDGTTIRCKVCNGTESAYETDNPRGIGGHIRIRHRDTTNMYDTEARAKALESTQVQPADPGCRGSRRPARGSDRSDTRHRRRWKR